MLAVVLAGLGGCPLRAVAQDGSLQAVRSMVEDARYDEAISAARELLRAGTLRARDHDACLELIAVSQLANRQNTEADATLAELYQRDPEHRLSDSGASPVVQAAFARAHDHRGTPLDVTVESATPRMLPADTRPVLVVRISAGRQGSGESPVRSPQGQ